MKLSRDSYTIQTHNAVSVPLSSNVQSGAYMDTAGFGEVAITLANDNATTTSKIQLLWSNDGTSDHGYEIVMTTGAGSRRAVSTPTKSRYLKVQIYNEDSAAAHTMSAWAYLKT